MINPEMYVIKTRYRTQYPMNQKSPEEENITIRTNIATTDVMLGELDTPTSSVETSKKMMISEPTIAIEIIQASI